LKASNIQHFPTSLIKQRTESLDYITKLPLQKNYHCTGCNNPSTLLKKPPQNPPCSPSPSGAGLSLPPPGFMPQGALVNFMPASGRVKSLKKINNKNMSKIEH